MPSIKSRSSILPYKVVPKAKGNSPASSLSFQSSVHNAFYNVALFIVWLFCFMMEFLIAKVLDSSRTIPLKKKKKKKDENLRLFFYH